MEPHFKTWNKQVGGRKMEPHNNPWSKQVRGRKMEPHYKTWSNQVRGRKMEPHYTTWSKQVKGKENGTSLQNLESERNETGTKQQKSCRHHCTRRSFLLKSFFRVNTVHLFSMFAAEGI